MILERKLILLFLTAYRMPTASSLSFVDEYYSGTVNDLLGPMVHHIANRYFINSRCICIITEEDGNILKYIPKSAVIFRIQIGGMRSTIQEIEDSDLLDSSKLTNGTRMFESLLIEAMDAGCESYIVQVRNIASVIHSFARSSRRAVTRSCKKFVYLPATLGGDTLPLEDIFSMEEMNHLPDTVISRFVNMERPQNFEQHGHEIKNYKCKSHMSNALMNSNSDVTMSFPEDRLVKNLPQRMTKNIDDTMTARECVGSGCDASEGGLYLERTDDTNTTKNMSMNLGIASGLNQATGKINGIEIVTLEFVGKKPSCVIVLDVWIADDRGVGFLDCADLFPDKMSNLQGREIRVATFSYLPFVVLIHDEKTAVYDGVEFLIFLEFANKVNATWKLVLDEGNFWGVAWPNGSGNGIVGKKPEDNIFIIIVSTLIIIKQYS
jgi:hypothetical protein